MSLRLDPIRDPGYPTPRKRGSLLAILGGVAVSGALALITLGVATLVSEPPLQLAKAPGADAKGVAETQRLLDQPLAATVRPALTGGLTGPMVSFSSAHKPRLPGLADLPGVEVTFSPGVDALPDGEQEGAERLGGETRRATVEDALKRLNHADAEGGTFSALRKRYSSLRSRARNGLRYRVYPGRVHVRLEAEPDAPAGLRWSDRFPDDFVSLSDGAEMVFVSGSELGPNGRAFLIDRHEVTVALYRRFLGTIERNGHLQCPKDEIRDKDHRPLGWDTAPYRELTGGEQGPVLGTDLLDALAFAAWAGKRLPTVAEWNAAAQGSKPRPASKTASPVGSTPDTASVLGAEDMFGNAAEWALDPSPEALFLMGGSYKDEDLKPSANVKRLHRPSNLGFRCAMDYVAPVVTQEAGGQPR